MEHKDQLLFIAQDTLQEIRDNKNNQRTTTYNFIIVTGILLGVFETLKNKFNVQSPNINLLLKSVIIAYGSFTVYLVIRFQKTLTEFRERMTTIWDDQSFKFAFDKGILKYRNDCKTQYYSFWNSFWGFTFLYVIMIVLIEALVCFLL